MKRGLKALGCRLLGAGACVTIYSPMKRGLKEAPAVAKLVAETGYNLFPDEKGTESHGRDLNRIGLVCYNLFPDEKGTESITPLPNLNQKGAVTIYSPMKRGLKAKA